MKPIYSLHRAYTQAEYELVEGARAACHCTWRREDRGNYETHHLVTALRCGRREESGRSGLCFSENYKGRDTRFTLEIKTALFAYAQKILACAHERTLSKYPDYMQHEWVKGSSASRRLLFTSPRRAEARAYCEAAIRAALNDPAIYVQESIVIRPSGEKGHLPEDGPDWEGNPVEIKEGNFRIDLIVNAAELPPDLGQRIIEWIKCGGAGTPIPFSTKPLRFTRDQVAAHIVELAPELLELFNVEEGRPPLSALDRQYLEAVGHLEIASALALIDEGANPNALDEVGESAIAILAEASRFDYCRVDDWEMLRATLPDITAAERIEMMRPLIARGANPDLFGYMGSLPLTIAIFRAEYETVRFLLLAGANPNINPYPDHDYALISDPLDITYCEQACCRGIMMEDPEREAILKQIEELLIRYGARLD